MDHLLLLERDHLLDRLERLLQAASQGQGSLVLVSGEAGVGKTTMVRAFAGRVGDRAVVLIGACDPLSTPRPLSPLLDIAADPASGIGDLLSSGAANYDVFADLLGRLRTALRPTLLVVEDVHWADEATLDLLRYVGRRVADTHAVVVATYRHDEVTRTHPLFAVIGDLVRIRESVHRMEIPPFTLDAVRRLAADSPVDPEELFELTGGNAFFVTEVLAAGDDLPTSVQDAVLARLARISHDAQQVVEAVSTAPRLLEVRHALALVDAAPNAVDGALAAGVVHRADDALAFRHELALAAVEGAMAPGHRVELHRRMVDILVEERSNDLARLAHHAVRTGDPGLILGYAPTAAAAAVSRGAPHQAVEFYAAALAHASQLDRSAEITLRSEYQRALSGIDDQRGSLDQAEEVLRLAEETGDVEQIGRGLITVARASWTFGDNERSKRTMTAAIELLDPLDDSATLTAALYLDGYLAMLNRRYQAAIASSTRSVEMATRIGSDVDVARATMTLGTAELVMGDVEHGVALVHEAMAMFERLGETTLVTSCYSLLGTGGGEARIYDRAAGWLEEAIQRARHTDSDYPMAYATAWLARIRCEQGRWDEAVALAEAVARVSPEVAKISPVTALGALGRVRVRRGDPGADEVLRRAVDLGRSGSLQHIWAPLCALAEHYWFQGRLDEAVGLLEGPYHTALQTDSPWARGELGFWLWWVGGLAVPPDGAAEPFALHMSGDWEAAALAWRAIGCPYEEALALAGGDDAAMLAALDILDRLQARPAALWVRSRLRHAGVDSIPRGPRQSTRTHPAGLTARQAEVLALMREGLANGDIAQRLFISKKTVEHHVSAVLAKLGVATRAEAITLGRQDGGGVSPT